MKSEPAKLIGVRDNKDEFDCEVYWKDSKTLVILGLGNAPWGYDLKFTYAQVPDEHAPIAPAPQRKRGGGYEFL